MLPAARLTGISSPMMTQNSSAGWPASPRVTATISAPTKPTTMPATPSRFGRRTPSRIDSTSVMTGDSVNMMPV